MLERGSGRGPGMHAISRKKILIGSAIILLGAGLCLVQLQGMSARGACIAAQTKRLIATSYQHVPERASYAASVHCDSNGNRAGPNGRAY